MRTVIRVTFKGTGEEYFFTSYSAIFKKFGKEEIGAVINSIWNAVRGSGGVYENKKVYIDRIDIEGWQREDFKKLRPHSDE